jgi:putative chitinase
MQITPEQLAQIIPGNPSVDQWCDALNKLLPKYNIDTPQRAAAFLAQCAHESGSFKFLKENLNYGAPGLMATFKKYFPTQELANDYARQPERIANRVYADRMGNGNEASGDGWRYRGRGLIQLTGRNNYTLFANSIEMPLEGAPEYLETFDGAVEGACWFWNTNKLNQWADAGDIDTMTRRINGGLHGIDDRCARYANALTVLGV